jgi:hypothetical protein
MPALTDFFLNPMALGLSLLIIPIIILYLLKPKPKHVKFPSIMFILRIEKTKRFSSWFKRFIRDPLLLIQIFIILLLVGSIANPFILSPLEQNPKSDVVFIIDGSASMQSTDVSPSRFEKSKSLMIDMLKRVNPESTISLIFAENIPILLVKRTDKETAKNIVERLRASDAPSNLQDAILFGIDLVADSKFEKKIYVFSDFSNVGDVELAKGIAQSKRIDIKFVKVFKKGKNLGITSIKGSRFLTKRGEFYLTFIVKNFNMDNEKEVIAEIFLDDELLTSIPKKIQSQSEELFHLKGTCSSDEHELRIRLKNNKDDLTLDDVGYWALPEIKQYKILLITNHDTYLRHALESNLDFIVEVANPPVIPKFKGFDTIIIGDIDPELILPGTFFELRKYIESESDGSIVIMASSGLNKIQDPHLEKLLPVKVKEVISAKSQINVKKNHESLQDVILENVIMKKYMKTQEKNGSVVIATIKNFPVIAFMDYKKDDKEGERAKRKIAYIGMNPNPEWSNFYLSSSFPIFWFQLIKWMNKEESLDVKNLKAGEYISFVNEMGIKTPSGGNMKTKELILDEVGIYEVILDDFERGREDKDLSKEKFSVNLVNDEESDIMNSLELETINDPYDFHIYPETILKETFLSKYLLIIVLILLALEVILYKRRGLI